MLHRCNRMRGTSPKSLSLMRCYLRPPGRYAAQVADSPGALTCPQSWRGSPASLQLSQSPYSCPSFAISSRCLHDAFAMFPFGDLWSLELPRLLWSFTVFPRVPQSSPEFPSLLWSSPVFARAPPCPPEFLLVCRSSSLSAGVPATSSEPLSLGVLCRFFVRLLLPSESFPVVSYDAAIAS